MAKTSLIKSYLGGWTGENLQVTGKARRKRKKGKAKTARLGKEAEALIKRRKKVKRILSEKSSLVSTFKSKKAKTIKL